MTYNYTTLQVVLQTHHYTLTNITFTRTKHTAAQIASSGTASSHEKKIATKAEGTGCQLYTQDQQAGEIPISEVSTKKDSNGKPLSITRQRGETTKK